VCGNIDNVTNCLANELEEDILKKKGFKVERHILEFYGICKKCKQK
jgi:Fur family ferric uptake transcriptional regulator